MSSAVHQQIFWIGSEACATVALITLSMSVGLAVSPLLGITFVGRKRVALTRMHEALSLTALIAVAGHVLLLLGDTYLSPTIVQLLVPFTMRAGGLDTSIGILAAYILFTTGLVFYLRDRIGGRWKTVHRLAAAGYVLAVLHAIGGAGKNATSVWFILAVGAFAVPGSLLTAAWVKRLRDKRLARQKALPRLTIGKEG